MLETPRLRFAYCLTVATLACGGGSSDTTEPPPPPPTIAGSYRLDTFNGTSIPGRPLPDILVDTGQAFLWPSGYYEIYVRAFANGSPQNYIYETGHWTEDSRSILFTSPGIAKPAPIGSGGRFTVGVLRGTTHELRFRRTGDAPPPPVRFFDNGNPPNYSGAMVVEGTGSAMVVSATLTVTNPDVIARIMTFSTTCGPYIWLTSDSLTFGRVVWSDYDVEPTSPRCLREQRTDTIAPAGQRTYVRRRPVIEFRFASDGSPVPPGRYFVWVMDDVEVSIGVQPRARLGWIMIPPFGP